MTTLFIIGLFLILCDENEIYILIHDSLFLSKLIVRDPVYKQENDLGLIYADLVKDISHMFVVGLLYFVSYISIEHLRPSFIDCILHYCILLLCCLW